MAKLWTDLHDYYLNDVPGVSYVTAANALRMAAQEFCARTKAWRITLPTITTLTATATYSFGITAEQEVSKVLSATLAGQDIGLLLHDQVGTSAFGLAAMTERECLLQPVPAAGLALIVKVVLKPSNESTGIENFLYAAHAEAIAQGAKARLFAMANQPFSNIPASAYARTLFETAIGNTSIRVAKAHSSAPLRVQASYL